MIDLYSVATSNGQKVHVMLEECGLAYTPHKIDLHAGTHRQPDFLKLNPFARVPVIVDRDAGDLAVGETLAILVYLAEKSGKFMPKDARGRSQVLQWMSGSSANIGSLFRNIFVLSKVVPGEHSAAIAYFRGEVEKILAMLDRELATRAFLVGDAYTIADISIYPFATTATKNIEISLAPYPNIQRWVEVIGQRPAVERGMKLFL